MCELTSYARRKSNYKAELSATTARSLTITLKDKEESESPSLARGIRGQLPSASTCGS